ncbi:MAG TPA: DUF3800 domain-containing protein [Dongiaceae bacterium]|nr:DUF3800 domain-containing protein [Dongiaceae bacterium]
MELGSVVGDVAAPSSIERNSLLLRPDTLAFFIDDSGDQVLGDPGNPLFALGGVSVMGSDYAAVAGAWSQATATISRPKGRLHFSERQRGLGRSNKLQIHKLLASRPIGRFAAIATRDSVLAGTTIEDVVLGSLKKRLEELLSWSSCRSIALVFEESARLKAAVHRHFDGMKVQADDAEVPHVCCWMPKSAGVPLLELADWLLHTVAAQVRHKSQNSHTDDFCAAFHSVNPKLASYVQIGTAFPNSLREGHGSGPLESGFARALPVAAGHTDRAAGHSWA